MVAKLYMYTPLCCYCSREIDPTLMYVSVKNNNPNMYLPSCCHMCASTKYELQMLIVAIYANCLTCINGGSMLIYVLQYELTDINSAARNAVHMTMMIMTRTTTETKMKITIFIW